MSIILQRLGVAAFIAATSFGFSASTAHAQPVCGDTINTNTTLGSDLLCPGFGLRIGASGVTLDCAGHTIEAAGGRVVEVIPASATSR